MTRPGMDLVRPPAGATDLVLLAHGGMENSQAVPQSWQPPILRMWPFAWAVRTAVPAAAIGLMRYRYRGWNGVAADPAVDLRTVLDDLPPVIRRVVLIGHSMGGRAVVAAGDHPRVAGVLALAPWLPPGEPLTALRPPITLAHGTEDTITDPRATAAYAERLRSAGTPVRFFQLAGETHPMLRRHNDWNTLVADFTTAALATPSTAAGANQSPEPPAQSPEPPAQSPEPPANPFPGPGAAPSSGPDDRDVLLPRSGRSSTAGAVLSIAVARLRLPVVARCSAGKGTAAGKDLG
ncbi:alpha/beta fold hydrolase [Kribbella sp. CA-247076]|uniref:alpha/beta hydrolase n=1 Tax=Kribbella sp. CA-247076 TaxID=3239941 RepID=UPI003D8C81E5